MGLLTVAMLSTVHVARVAKLLAGTDVKLVTVVGFPLGASARAAKAFECELAVRDGAHEIVNAWPRASVRRATPARSG